MSQLTLDGREVPHEFVMLRPRLGGTQRAVLTRLASQPGMTSSELAQQIQGGDEAVRRLARRGLAVKYVGLWFAAKDGWE